MKDKKLNDKYNPQDFEEKLYQEWEEKGYFKPNMDKTKESYCIMMPPPNVTGKLHMGHALDDTIQDILIRFKRMQGYNTLWLPGSDHAAIATEVKVVEKMKKEEGLTKADITREQFLERAWAWTKEYGGTILNQLKKLGCSCDWSRERFTMDEGLSNAVKYVFIKGIYVSVPIFSTFVMYNTNATENINNPIILYSGFSPSVFFKTNFLKSSINPTRPKPIDTAAIGIKFFATDD